MKVIRGINNNVAICVDNHGRELIAFGKGIGFFSESYELEDLSRIDRTFYDIDESHLKLLDEIDKEIFEISANIVDYAGELMDRDYSSNFVFALADHIYFVVDSYKKGLKLKIPFSYDIEYLYDKEKKIGDRAISYINKKLNIKLPQKEAIGIALHFINANKETEVERNVYNEEKIIKNIVQIIEKEYKISIDTKEFNYYRFATHMSHLLKRMEDNKLIESNNNELYKIVKKEYKKTYDCLKKIEKLLNEMLGKSLSEEEKLYLMLHINRICSRTVK